MSFSFYFSNFMKENVLSKLGGHKYYAEISHSEVSGACWDLYSHFQKYQKQYFFLREVLFWVKFSLIHAVAMMGKILGDSDKSWGLLSKRQPLNNTSKFVTLQNLFIFPPEHCSSSQFMILLNSGQFIKEKWINVS